MIDRQPIGLDCMYLASTDTILGLLAKKKVCDGGTKEAFIVCFLLIPSWFPQDYQRILSIMDP